MKGCLELLFGLMQFALQVQPTLRVKTVKCMIMRMIKQTHPHTHRHTHTRNEATNQHKRKQAAHLTAVELQREFIASALQRHALVMRVTMPPLLQLCSAARYLQNFHVELVPARRNLRRRDAETGSGNTRYRWRRCCTHQSPAAAAVRCRFAGQSSAPAAPAHAALHIDPLFTVTSPHEPASLPLGFRRLQSAQPRAVQASELKDFKSENNEGGLGD